jgi:hypothetical protein
MPMREARKRRKPAEIELDAGYRAMGLDRAREAAHGREIGGNPPDPTLAVVHRAPAAEWIEALVGDAAEQRAKKRPSADGG